jgi:hypothetical protein
MDLRLIPKACVGLCLLAGCSTIRSAVSLNKKEKITEPVSGVVEPLSTDYSYLGGGLVGLAMLCVGYLWLVEFKKADAKGD